MPALMLPGDAEIQVDGLRVADMQIAVRFRGETRMDTAAELVRTKVVGDDLTDEIDTLIQTHGISRGVCSVMNT